MNDFDKKQHWEHIYTTKALNEVSWYQPVPSTSLQFVEQFKIAKTAKIIDVGGGDSFFVDHLLALGYLDITVLDIAAAALERAKKRLGDKASKVKWIVADAANFQATEHYDFWHDRAAFHFLTQEAEIAQYINTMSTHLNPEGKVVLGTFSEQGPKKCSGIDIRQYSEKSMTETMAPYFENINCVSVDHATPFDTLQHFIFCSFRKNTIRN